MESQGHNAKTRAFPGVEIFRRSLALLGWSLERRQVPARHPEELAAIIAGLAHLNRSTEKDFLATGDQLQQILQTVREISSDIAALTGAFAGERGDQNIGALMRLLDDFRRIEGGIEAGGVAFEAIQQAAIRTGKGLNRLGRILPALKVVGTCTRIEAARLGAAGMGFEMVAEEVNALTERIRAEVQTAVEAASVLGAKISGSLRTLAGLRDRQLSEVPAAIADLMDTMERLRTSERKASATSQTIAEQFAAVSASIEQLVTDLQFHDITRQQVEHVIEALDQVRHSAEADHGRLPSDAARILALEASQLENSCQTFEGSSTRIGEALGRIGARLLEMAEASRTFWGDSAHQDGNLFLELERALTVVLRESRGCSEADAATGAAAADLERTLRQMRASASGVESIDTQMQRMALNATIRAAHIGEKGQALGVLAGDIHQLALECGSQADQVVGLLDEMLAAAANLTSRRAAAQSIGEGAASGPSTKLGATLDHMHAASESAYSRLLKVDSLSANLSESVTRLRSHFTAGELFRGVVGRSVASLNVLLGQAEPVPAAAASVAAAAGLGDLAGRYTMQTERDVHACATGGVEQAGPEPAGPPLATAAAGAEDFGDNVELF